MAQLTPLKLNIASPCPEKWEDMQGDERSRNCARCKLNVYNLHELRMSEVETLLRGKTGRLCVRFYQRKDGTVLTRDCPVGLQKVRIRLAAGLVTSVAFVAAVFATVLELGSPGGISGFWSRHVQYEEDVRGWPVVESIGDPIERKHLRMGFPTNNSY